MTRRFPLLGARRVTAVGALGRLAAGGAPGDATGGTRHGWLHMLYVPILLSAWGFGVAGGVVTGAAAGLAVGPAMPLDVAAGTMQEPLNWLARLGAFAGVGAVGGALFSSLRRGAAALAHSERRFAALLRHAPDLIFVRAPDGTIRYASPSAATILGHEPQTMVGEPLD
jgi:PAS domain-containing protein